MSNAGFTAIYSHLHRPHGRPHYILNLAGCIILQSESCTLSRDTIMRYPRLFEWKGAKSKTTPSIYHNDKSMQSRKAQCPIFVMEPQEYLLFDIVSTQWVMSGLK